MYIYIGDELLFSRIKEHRFPKCEEIKQMLVERNIKTQPFIKKLPELTGSSSSSDVESSSLSLSSNLDSYSLSSSSFSSTSSSETEKQTKKKKQSKKPHRKKTKKKRFQQRNKIVFSDYDHNVILNKFNINKNWEIKNVYKIKDIAKFHVDFINFYKNNNYQLNGKNFKIFKKQFKVKERIILNIPKKDLKLYNLINKLFENNELIKEIKDRNSKQYFKLINQINIEFKENQNFWKKLNRLRETSSKMILNNENMETSYFGYSYVMNKNKSKLCELCKKINNLDIIEDLDHFLWNCSAYENNCKIWISELKKINISKILNNNNISNIIIKKDSNSLLALVGNKLILESLIKFLNKNLGIQTNKRGQYLLP
ncbi:bromodomain testis-specific protein [Anaeramoeba flamelloides]|uniref:Bromodomain testis-specific protein n=1 Tax=Anaeramoeba flamelloides TaxID=1746091 RepID=A0AAV7YU35_9EUKA|nr:bromodomain testis-specific protein [Anaeramoeba flamelloides]